MIYSGCVSLPEKKKKVHHHHHNCPFKPCFVRHRISNVSLVQSNPDLWNANKASASSEAQSHQDLGPDLPPLIPRGGPPYQ